MLRPRVHACMHIDRLREVPQVPGMYVCAKLVRVGLEAGQFGRSSDESLEARTGILVAMTTKGNRGAIHCEDS